MNYAYTYDNNGRITGISTVSSVQNLSGTTAYTYDELGQLISETNGNTTYQYAYDSKGNISSRKLYSGETLVDTDTFTYGATVWEDRLTGYNNGTIIYDTIGNPTSYLGATLTWRGRELSQYAKGNTQISYSYDVDGMRYKKTVTENNSVTAVYDYVYSDGKLILLTHTANGTANTARFIYDSFGEPRGFILNNSAAYLYLKNGQGDITAIVDENGAVLLTYAYTAWGEITYSATSMQNMLLAATLSNVNPFTYRGYCYDFDIGMYYLQSRYYDPVICRFINADSTDYLGATGTLLSYNLFAYCENDPVDYVDETGLAKKNSNSKKIAQNLCKAITIGILANNAIAQAPMAKHIMTMKKFIINYGFTKRYNLSTISIYAYTKKWYYLEEYDILSFGTTRKNWYDLYDDINALLSLESITGVVVSVVALTKILPKLIAIAEILAIPVSIVVIMASSAASKLEKKLRELKDGDWYQFNWYVKRRYTPLFGNTEEEYLSYYSPLATIS